MYNLNNVLVASSIPAIIAVGQTFAVTTAGIDLSVSSTMTLGAVVFGLTFTNGWPLWGSAVAGTIAGFLCGVLNGVIIAKRKISDFIVTLGMLSVAAGFALVFSDGTLAGFAAMLTISRIGAAEPAANTSILLNSVAAVVLGGVSLFGGRGTIFGPFVATLLLQALTNGLTVVGVAAYYQYVSIGLVVILSAALVRTK